MLCCVEGLGPVRFGGWDDKGRPIPAYPTAPIIRCFATEEDQAGNTFEGVYYMLSEGPAVDDFPGLDVGITRINLPDGGRIVATTSAASSKDGGRDTFNVFDETHLWTLPRLKKLHATVTRNIMKRALSDGWSLETSTMYAPGEGSVAEGTHKSAKAIPGVLFDHVEAPREVDLEDDEAVIAALRGLYGPAAEWMDLEGIVSAELRDPQKRESDFRRYWLNQPWTVEEKFVTPAQWDGCAARTRFPGKPGADGITPIPDGSPVVLSLDGSHNNDATALSVILVDDVPHVDVVGLWERPEEASEGWRVDILDVEQTIFEAARRWTVLELTADPYRWARTLQVCEDAGLPVVEFPQNASHMAPATKRLYDLIATQGLTHSGDVDLRRHMLNANTKNDARGFRLAKEEPNSPLKIDLAVTTVMGVDRAASHDGGPPSEPNVWNLEDLLDEEDDDNDPLEEGSLLSPELRRRLLSEIEED